ncbi:MAG: OmpH family outer membrane protein [Chthoniobacteraceae bacterium]
MKKHLIIPLLSLVFSLAFAGTASAELKIGTVDMKKLFESFWRTKEAETKMSEMRAVLKRDLDERVEKRKELQDLIEKLNDDIKKPELSKDTAAKKMKERDDKIGEWQTMMRELQQYQAEKDKQVTDQTLRIRNGIVEEILKVVNEKTQAENFDLVFDTSGNSINNVPVVISAKPSYDFTKDVIEKLNASRPKSAAAEAPAEKPAEKPADKKGKK